jgi:hypothetical protein
MDPNALRGKPPVLGSIRPDLGARLVRWVADDMERAKKARERKKKPARDAGAEPPKD